MRAKWLLGAALTAAIVAACGAPRAERDGGADARVREDGASEWTDAGESRCPEDVTGAVGAPCERAGDVCRSAACEGSQCDPECALIRCTEAPDGPVWAREEACAEDAGMPDAGSFDAGSFDAGSFDAGVFDGGLDGGLPDTCSPVGVARDTTIHDLEASGGVSSIVWDGMRYAMVWNALTSRDPIRFSIFFGLADRDGDLVPGSVHRVFDTPEHQAMGVLAVGDGELGLAFIRGSTAGLTAHNRAYFVRLDRDGWPIDSPTALSSDHTPHNAAAIAWSPDRREWAVAWQGVVPLGGGYVNHHAYLSRVNASSELLAPNAVLLDALTSTTSPDEAPSMVWAGDRWAIGLNEYVEVGNARVVVAEIDPESVTISRRIIVDESARPSRVALATDGTMYGVAWMEIISSDPLSNEVHFRRAMVGGDALGEELLLGEPELSSGEPAVIFDGSEFSLVFNEGGALWHARISRDGATIGTPGPILAGTPPYSPFPKIASDGCNDAIAWTAVFPETPQRAEVRLRVMPR